MMPFSSISLPVTWYGTFSSLPPLVRLTSRPRLLTKLVFTIMSNSASPFAGSTKLLSLTPSAKLSPIRKISYSRPLTATSRSFGFSTFTRTMNCWANMSADMIWMPTRLSCGATSFGPSDVQDASVTRSATNVARSKDLGIGDCLPVVSRERMIDAEPAPG